MIIKKIYIKNFKGIRDKKIIQFNENVTLLTGPNGFGKTTIFDIIELCLTGQMNRTYQKSSITKDSKDYKKPFYQNTKNEDVVIKVWLVKNELLEPEDFIITKFLSKNNTGSLNGGRKNKPTAFELLETYKEETENFDNDEFIPSSDNKITQEDIDEFFGFEYEEFKLDKIYNLFNYLQQEETTFFLKKSEGDRNESLGFLFKTNKFEQNLTNLSTKIKNLNSISVELNKKIDKINYSQPIESVDYSRLFIENDFQFDSEDIFENIDVEQSSYIKNEYIEELNELLGFIKIFSPDEYKKRIKVESMQDIINNNKLLAYFISQELLEKNNYEDIKKRKELFEDENMISAYILQKFSTNKNELEKNNDMYIKFENFLKLVDLDDKINSLKNIIDLIAPEEKEGFLEVLKNRENLKSTSQEIDLTISEIIRFRNNIQVNLSKHNLDNGECPYCGEPWESTERLLEKFNEREKSLKALSSNQVELIQKTSDDINNNYITPITDKIKKYIEDNDKIDNKLLDLILKNNIKFNFEYLESLLDDSKKYKLNNLDKYDDYLKIYEKLKAYLESKMNVEENVIDLLSEVYNMDFENELEQIKKIFLEEEMQKYIINIDYPKIDYVYLKKQANDFKVNLQNQKDLIQYNVEKAKDTNNLYEKYFNGNENEFCSFNENNVNNVEEKIKYIEYKYAEKNNTVLNKLLERQQKLGDILESCVKIKSTYDETLKSYKKNMADKIKIPFYIYTAKMLQNYQQGMGVFLSTRENASIRFLTDSSTDHDAMHHLSSGQLAVIALAFTLAINKTYNISDNLKMLVIDDPVQEMDALNIHSFIELIRHEFLIDYQLVFSTHNDETAIYMKYLFEKYNNKDVSLINVQHKLFT